MILNNLKGNTVQLINISLMLQYQIEILFTTKRKLMNLGIFKTMNQAKFRRNSISEQPKNDW